MFDSPQTFPCSNCGGTVTYRGDGPLAVCPYCGASTQVPQELLQAAQAVQVKQTMSAGMRYLVIFLVIVVVVPTCIGLAASWIGLVVGIAAPLLAVILSIFFR